MLIRPDELSTRLRLWRAQLHAGVDRLPVAVAVPSTPQPCTTGAQPASNKRPRGVSRRARALAARLLMKHARDTWHQRTKELNLVAPDSMVAPRAIEFVLPKLELSADHLVVDLGCGDGRWLAAAASRYGCRGIGVEIDAKVAAAARRRLAAENLQHLVTIKEEDLFTTPLDEATHVIMFLSIGGAKGLARRFEEALRPGTVVVSCGFKLPGWTPFRRFSPSESKWLPVFMYRKDEEAVVPQR